MLRVEHVSKTYNPPGRTLRLLVRTAAKTPVIALDDITFELKRGEILGLIGPNGAGKSTLIRICTSLLTPSRGQVLIDGQDIADSPASQRARIGIVLADERALYWRLTGRANLRFFGVMSGMSPEAADTRAGELMEELGLAHRDRRVFGYSSGMRMRLSLARALLPDPELIILDEPTRSLDPVATSDFHDTLRKLADRGRAVLLASHRLDEVESLCDSVLVLLAGRQRAWTRTEELSGGAAPIAETLRQLLISEVPR